MSKDVEEDWTARWATSVVRTNEEGVKAEAAATREERATTVNFILEKEMGLS
jgi:hypothetical protein